MAFALPAVSNAIYENNFPATPSLTPGASLSASATPHTKGSWQPIIDPVDFDSFGFWLQLTDSSATATQTDMLVDIAIGPTGGGSEQVIVSNLIAGWSQATSPTIGVNGRGFFLPIFIQKGVRVSGRSQALITNDVVLAIVVLAGGRSGLGFPICAGMDDYGINTATSGGTSHTPGNSGAESAYA